ncbi:MAG: nucleoside triphosphate pyrophosphohydrolase [Paracoccaceae bacterium]
MNKSLKIERTHSLKDLLNIINHLRDPKKGCEWDIKQTAKTLSSHIIEEAYELVEAIESENNENIIDELGDLLLQVIFQSQIANEKKQFNFEEVVDKASKKMIRRHPHIFGENKEKKSIKEQKIFWEEIKRKERKEKGEKASPFAKFNKFMPPINQAIKLQKTASTLGLDFSNIKQVILKIEEETKEVKEALKNIKYNEKKEEIGDLFFSLINLTRLLNFDPEHCIHEANKKFAKRSTVYFSLKEKKEIPLTKEQEHKLWQLTKSKVKNEHN